MIDFHAGNRRLDVMSRIAAIFMFFAWLLYGAMPAVAAPSAPIAVEAHFQHRDHGRHDDGGKAETAHVHGSQQKPCPHGAKTCVAPFCAACITLLPEIATGDDGRFVYAYPSPAVAQPFVSPAAAPPTPPPRA